MRTLNPNIKAAMLLLGNQLSPYAREGLNQWIKDPGMELTFQEFVDAGNLTVLEANIAHAVDVLNRMDCDLFFANNMIEQANQLQCSPVCAQRIASRDANYASRIEALELHLWPDD